MTYKQTGHCILFLFHSAPQNMPVTDTTHFFRTTQMCKVTHLSLLNDPVPNYMLHMHTFAYKFTCKTNWNVCSISIFHYDKLLEEYQNMNSENVNIFLNWHISGCTSSICVIKTAKEGREVILCMQVLIICKQCQYISLRKKECKCVHPIWAYFYLNEV